MGFHRGPKIVTDSLRLYLDAANPKSYPGTGTTVIDLSGNNNNGVLLNGLLATNGVFILDGANDVINLGIGNTFFPLYTFTLEIWVKSTGLGSGQSLGGIWGFTYGLRAFINGNGTVTYGINDNTGGGVGQTYYTTNSNIFFNGEWNHLVIQNDGYTSYIYVNGLLDESGPAIWTGSTYWTTNTVNLGRDNNNSMYFLNGQLALPKIYSRVLSAEEVLQNYNATKSRFNL